MKSHWTGFAAAMAIAACASPDDMSAVESAATKFNGHMIMGESQAIFDEASVEYQDVTRANMATATQVNAVIAQKLAACKDPMRDPHQVLWNRSTGGYFVTVVYDWDCTDGRMGETLVFRIDDGVAKLVGFNFNGPQFLPQAPSPTPPATETPKAPAPATTTIPI